MSDSFTDTYDSFKNICYNLLGRHLDQWPLGSVEAMLYQADMELTSGAFLSMAIICSLLSAIPVLVFSLIIFGQSVYTYGLVAVDVIVVIIMFPFVAYNNISNKKQGIEREIPFALAYMSILSSAGSTPLEMLRRMAIEDYGEISKEFRKVVYHIDVLGEDEVTAMNNLAYTTPSDIFRSIVIDLTNIMYSGSGMKAYLESKSKDLLNIKRQTQKEFVDSLSVYGELYMGGILMLAIMAVIGIVLCGALNVDIGPFLPSQAFSFFIYLILPLANIIFYFILEMKYSRSP
jgi:flagellar protein FlaJ